MKKRCVILTVASLFFATFSASAFDLSKLGDALKDGTVENVINGVISSSNIDVKDLAGSWHYKAPAVAFESEDMLNKAGGIAMAAAIEAKLAPYYKKAGLDNATITFDENGAFTMTFKKGKLSGTVTKEDSGFIFHFNSVAKLPAASMKAHVSKGTTLEITFDASKLVSLISTIASATGNSTANSAASLLKNYKGVYAGFEFGK